MGIGFEFGGIDMDLQSELEYIALGWVSSASGILEEVGTVGGFIQHGELFDCLIVDENFLIQRALIPFISILECY
jgi:hypothetical protein